MRVRRLAGLFFEAITAFLILGMVFLTLLQVVTRYLDAGFEWTEELARLDLIYLTFFGSIVAFQRRDHLRIETMVNALEPGTRRAVRVAVDLTSIAVLAVVVWQGVPLLMRFWPLVSAALGWPTTVFYLPVVIGCFVMMIYHALDILDALQGREEHTTREVGP